MMSLGVVSLSALWSLGNGDLFVDVGASHLQVNLDGVELDGPAVGTTPSSSWILEIVSWRHPPRT